ncbi:cyclophilin-like peptidyl-prolyl cis-trans isomerase family protein [Wolffia australiana]
MARIKPQALLIQSKKKKGPARIGLRTIITWVLVVIVIAFSFYASYTYWQRRQGGQHDFSIQEPHGSTKKTNLPGYVVLSTEKGSITVELSKDAPSDVLEKFVDLCQKGFFKGMLFQCIVKNFVIQGGKLQKPEILEEWVYKGKSRLQIDSSPKHDAFMLGTSQSKNDDQSFDLLITTTPISDLNDSLVAFGRVIHGKDVVQEIEGIDTDEHCQPKLSVAIVDVSLKQEI